MPIKDLAHSIFIEDHILLQPTLVHRDFLYKDIHGKATRPNAIRDYVITRLLLKTALSEDLESHTDRDAPDSLLDMESLKLWQKWFRESGITNSIKGISPRQKKVRDAIATRQFIQQGTYEGIEIHRRILDVLSLLPFDLLVALLSRFAPFLWLMGHVDAMYPEIGLYFKRIQSYSKQEVFSGYYTNITRRREEHKLRQFELWVKKSPYAFAGICQILNSLDGSPESRELNHIVALYPEFRAKDTTDKRRFHWAAGYCPDSGDPYLYFGPLEPKEYPISGRDFHTLLVER